MTATETGEPALTPPPNPARPGRGTVAGLFAWQSLAACQGADPELFFPEGNPASRAVIRQAEQAKAVCSSCLVAAECLAWAVTSNTQHGVYGGLTGEERAAYRQRLIRRGGIRLVHLDAERDRGNAA